MTMRIVFDSDNADYARTRLSRTGFIIFLNYDPINWFYINHTSIESSSFGSEFLAMENSVNISKA